MNLQAAIKNLAAGRVTQSENPFTKFGNFDAEQMHRVSDRQLPAWFMVFGVIYDAESIVSLPYSVHRRPERNNDTAVSWGFGHNSRICHALSTVFPLHRRL